MSSSLEDQFLNQIRAKRLPEPKREFIFHSERKWRLDFAWPDLLLAIEVHGGNWVGGRHSRPKGMNEDFLKIGSAQIDGWTVLQLTGDMVKNLKGIELARALFDSIAADLQHEA